MAIVALGPAPHGAMRVTRLRAASDRPWARLASAIVVVALLAVAGRGGRGVLASRDFRGEAEYWQSLGDAIDHASNVVALAHDYGYRLECFGWVEGSSWSWQAGFA